jgi:KamA family protein
MNEIDEISRDITKALEYIRKHIELTNILLTGGDPLILSTQKLGRTLHALRKIDHINIIRIGTKMLSFNPFRIINDPALLEMLNTYSIPGKRIYVMTHFNHPREITNEAIKAVDLLIKAGVVLCNQTPLLKGINDDHEVLAELLRKLSFVGVAPYYIFQCRPTLGNKLFSVAIEDGFEIFEKARMKCSGLAKRARFVMSHSTGKIEIVGKTDERVYFRYHRAANPEEKARFMVFKRNPEAYWFDDYDEIIHDYAMENPYRCFGPE